MHSRTRPARRPLLLLVLLLMVFSACSTTRPPGPEAREEPEELPTPVRLADYEDFDATPYEEAPPEAQTEIQHDVPERLMAGRTTTGTTTVQGFRVQVYSTLDKTAAVNLEEEARAWWRAERSRAPAGLMPEQLPIYTVYLQPYYRVRIGNFRTRAEADRARQILARRFPDAFIVPDRVTVPR